MKRGLIVALVEMLSGAAWRRRDWRGWVIMSLMDRKYWYVWPSGTVHLWIPTPEDLAADDWEPAG